MNNIARYRKLINEKYPDTADGKGYALPFAAGRRSRSGSALPAAPAKKRGRLGQVNTKKAGHPGVPAHHPSGDQALPLR
jgi:hypothetical protein